MMYKNVSKHKVVLGDVTLLPNETAEAKDSYALDVMLKTGTLVFAIEEAGQEAESLTSKETGSQESDKKPVDEMNIDELREELRLLGINPGNNQAARLRAMLTEERTKAGV